ncbi:acyl-CoA dehydrogenase family protein [Sphingopyxis sp. PET50]|uniref:acyl-CoA dehydrogenase family protein n=1 Tax=Sphingopyxis sp. PET50 TaxID=2976533 RepID=UPI0021AEBBED|nr:acyl-CoA dehydrogenase family protein [Sphingopyxis sp. PET50]
MSASPYFEAAERIVRDLFDSDSVRRGSSGAWLTEGWRAIEALGLPQALVDEADGGLGIDPAEAADMLRLVGYWAVPLPLAEAMLGASLLARGRMAGVEGPVTLAPPHRTTIRIERREGAWFAEGRATRVPWARDATTLLLIAPAEDSPYLVAMPASLGTIEEGVNLAGEPRDDFRFSTTIPATAVLPGTMTPNEVHAAGAALRTIMIAGAAQRLLDLTLGFADEHQQFGRPIAKFQAVQQNLAALAGQAAVCRAACDMAAQALFTRDGRPAIAMAKSRAGEAAALTAHLAHQVHGAIGFTEEYDLHLYSRRILAWREEYGNEAEWNAVVGQSCLDSADGAWALITRHGEFAR